MPFFYFLSNFNVFIKTHPDNCYYVNLFSNIKFINIFLKRIIKNSRKTFTNKQNSPKYLFTNFIICDNIFNNVYNKDKREI